MTPRRIIRFVLATLVVALLALPATASAATIVVSTTDDDPISELDDTDCTLREAVQAANTNTAIDDCTSGDPVATNFDTVELPITGSYLLDNTNVNDDVNETGDLDVQASSGTGGPLRINGTAAGVIIDAQGFDRVLHHLSGNVTLTDLTMTGGARQSDNGGGILSVGADLSLTGVTVTDSSSGFGARGGGIYFAPASAATLTVTDSTISDNLLGDDSGFSGNVGGGIAVGPNGDLDMTGSTVTGNDIVENGVDGSTHGGGGIWAGGSPPEITGSTISGNTVTVGPSASTVSSPQGGGVLFESTGGGKIVDSTISGNGVIDSNASTALSPAGGGVAFVSTGGAGPEFSILNSTIASNTVSGDGTFGGGGLFVLLNSGQNVRVTHTTLTANEASIGGDALTAGGVGTMFLKNSIFDDPDATHTDTCVSTGTALTSLGHNLAEGTSCVDDSVVASDVDSTDPGLEALDDFGGPTETSPPGVTSPAIDLVPSPASCDDGEAVPTTLTEDQRGFARPFDGDGDATADCDAGAVEVYPCEGANATRIGGPGFDTMVGTSADDVMHGLGGIDQMSGGIGADKLCGGADPDAIEGGAGDDELDGGPGGPDAVTYTEAPSAVGVDLGSGTAAGGDGDDTLDGFEDVTGSSHTDFNLIGDAGPNVMSGGGGDDELVGRAGDDQFFGGPGSDRVSFEGSPAGVNANLVTDIATGEGATPTSPEDLVEIERLTGSDNAGDTLTGDDGANELNGANFDDIITGGGGPDDVVGQGGADQFFVRDGVGDQVDCGPSDPAIDQVETDAAGVDTLANCIAPDVISFPAVMTPGPPGSCAGKSATVVGTAGNDTLTGTAGPDVIDAKGGNDTVKGLGGKDLVCGAAGNDNLVGGGGNDTLNGGAGKDRLKGGAGKDRLLGKGGKDRCAGGGGRDRGKGCERRAGIP